jgi:hypothetical protein
MVNQCHRWTLFGFCIFEIIIAIILIVVVVVGLNNLENTDPDIKPDEWEAAKVVFSYFLMNGQEGELVMPSDAKNSWQN